MPARPFRMSLSRIELIGISLSMLTKTIENQHSNIVKSKHVNKFDERQVIVQPVLRSMTSYPSTANVWTASL